MPASSVGWGRHVVVTASVVVMIVRTTVSTTTASGATVPVPSSSAIRLTRLADPVWPLNRHSTASRGSIRVVAVARVLLTTRWHHHVVVQVHTAIATSEFRVLEGGGISKESLQWTVDVHQERGLEINRL